MKNIKKGVFLGVIALLITACSTPPKGNKVKTSPEKEVTKASTTAPQFLIDRTEWGIVYKSSKLGNAAINDNIGIAINLETK